MRWIVTGGCGFIGKNLCIELIKQGQDVLVIDKVSWDESGYEGLVGRKERSLLKHLKRDLTKPQDLDFSEWFSPGGGDVLVHLAAMSGVMDCSDQPLYAFNINVGSTFALLDGAAGFGCSCFIFASSGAVVSGSIIGRPSEVDPPCPLNVYGSMKAAAEQFCRGFSAEKGLPTASLRFSNVYGPYSEHKRSVVHAFVRAALSGDPVRIHGDGRQKRDFVYVGDVVDAIIGAAHVHVGETKPFYCDKAAVFNVSSGRPIAILDEDDNDQSLCDEIFDVVGGAGQVKWVDGDPGVDESSLNSDYSRRVLRIGKPMSLSEGIHKTVEWYRKRLLDSKLID